MDHAGDAPTDSRPAGGFDAHEVGPRVDEPREDAHGVRSAADAGGDHIGHLTFAEQGLDYHFGAMIGVFAPAGVPKEIISRLHADMGRVMQMPDVREAFAKQAIDPLTFPSPEAYAAQFRRDIEEMGKLVRAAGIQPQ